MSDTGGLVIGVNHDDYIPSVFAIGLQRVSRFGVPTIFCRGYAGRLDLGRNEVMRTFVQDYEEEWLLMVDTDMVFTPQHVVDLMKKADAKTNPLTGGLYVTEEQRPVAMKWIDGHTRHWDGKGTGLVEVDIIGFGFTVIHRSVLEAFGDTPWCDNARTGPKGQALSDDFSFMYTCTQLGYQPKLNTDVKVGHVKSAILFPEGYE